MMPVCKKAYGIGDMVESKEGGVVAHLHKAYRASGRSSWSKGLSASRMQLQMTVMTKVAAKRFAETGKVHNVIWLWAR